MSSFVYTCKECGGYYESFDKTCTYQHPPTNCNHDLEQKLTGGTDGRKQKKPAYTKGKSKSTRW